MPIVDHGHGSLIAQANLCKQVEVRLSRLEHGGHSRSFERGRHDLFAVIFSTSILLRLIDGRSQPSPTTAHLQKQAAAAKQRVLIEFKEPGSIDFEPLGSAAALICRTCWTCWGGPHIGLRYATTELNSGQF
jgi:hypothetical protein